MIRITNVRLIDPISNTDTVTDVYIDNGHILKDIQPQAAQVTETVDGSNQWLMPAFVDLCARLREPGQQQHGTLKTEGGAARHYGILHVVTPPDTKPILESGALLPGLHQRAWQDANIHLHIIGALTQGLEGKQPANLASLKQGGCIAVSNANAGFTDDNAILLTLEYAASLGLSVFFYPEEHSLANEGCVHDGFMATRQGLAPIPRVAETVALAKLLLLVEQTGITAHFGLLSCGDSVALIKQAKQKGLPVSASVAMHQLYLNDSCTDGFNAMAHVRPPLREESDRLALLQGVIDGTIDAICSHHEPLSDSAKLAPFADTAPGISSIDSFISLGIMLVQQQHLTALQLANRLVTAPAKAANIEAIRQQTGGWVLINPTEQYTLDAKQMLSKGKNTPFIGQTLQGVVKRVFA